MFSRARGADINDDDRIATIKRLAIEVHRSFEEALLDKVVGGDENGGRGGQGKGWASVIVNAQLRLLLMFLLVIQLEIPPVCSLSCVLLSILEVHKLRILYKFLHRIDKSYRPSSHRAIQRLYLGKNLNSRKKRETRHEKKKLPRKSSHLSK